MHAIPSEDPFVITSQRGAKCVFHARSFDANGWLDTFGIDFEADDFRASTRVANLPYGRPPSELFSRIAARWEGWKGVDEWKSMEGELVIGATCDWRGQVALRFTLLPSPLACYWSATAFVFLEAGQLDGLARDARAFFEEKPTAGSSG